MILRQVCLIAADVPRLRSFYETVLDIRFEGDDVHSMGRAAGVELVLYDRRAAQEQMGLDLGSPPVAGTLWLNWETDDVDRDWARLTAAGLTPEGPVVTRPWGARSFQIRDPEGNIVGFVRPPA